MAWCRPDDKPSSEPMMDCRCFVSSICITRPQYVNELLPANTGYGKLSPRTDKTGSCYQIGARHNDRHFAYKIFKFTSLYEIQQKSYLMKVTPLMRGKMTPRCRRYFEINFNEWKLLYFDLTFFGVCSTATHELGYHVSRAVVTQADQLWPIWPTLANLTGKLQTTFYIWIPIDIILKFVLRV